MTRKDYVLIAARFADLLRIDAELPAAPLTYRDGVADAARHLATELQRDNPRFDRERFLKAAGIQS
jgi:hypothetical protein